MRKIVNSHKVFTIIVPFKFIIIVMHYIELYEEVALRQKGKKSLLAFANYPKYKFNNNFQLLVFRTEKQKINSKSYKLQVDK